ncbi:MAG: hypothetical protein WCE45_01355 [Sedimentisphaerales bacterium]
MFLLEKIKKWGHKSNSDTPELCDKITWYPNIRDAQPNPDSSQPVQIPPLMVRRAAWRK